MTDMTKWACDYKQYTGNYNSKGIYKHLDINWNTYYFQNIPNKSVLTEFAELRGFMDRAGAVSLWVPGWLGSNICVSHVGGVGF